MSIAESYQRYLDQWQATVPVRALHEQPEAIDLIALRHDVDYDLDLALEMASVEQECGARATYYILHTAEYWQDPLLVEKCLQLQDFGHEVGLHNNLIFEWITGQSDDIATRLTELLTPFREAGVDIVGVASHGDRLCYEHNFSNSWLFAELRPEDPHAELDGLSAEGVPVSDKDRHVSYPPDHRLRRDGSEVLDLWQLSLADYGLMYDASFVQHDRYFTDSGGGWKRSPDPAACDLRHGRSQILMHPIYWRGDQRVYFFLSTARSGSKWLATMLDRSANVTSRHEFTLNHRYDGSTLRAEKRTGAGFTDLLADGDKSRRLLGEAIDWISHLPGDYVECNIYLESMFATVREVAGDAQFVHLHRNPADTVRSLMNRGWYDTPEDDRHMPMDWSGDPETRQFEQCCRYVAGVHDRLLVEGLPRISFEQMTTDADYLRCRLREIGIRVFPTMLDRNHAQRINANRNDSIPAFDEWPAEWRRIFSRICGRACLDLGYDAMDLSAGEIPARRLGECRMRLRRWVRALISRFRQRRKTLMDAAASDFCASRLGEVRGGAVSSQDDGLHIQADTDSHMSVLLRKGRWNACSRYEGWRHVPGTYVRGRLVADFGTSTRGTLRVYCLCYDAAGKRRDQRCVGFLRPDSPECAFAFRPPSQTCRTNVAVYVAQDQPLSSAVLKKVRIERAPLDCRTNPQ
jgi:hypothetical protein